MGFIIEFVISAAILWFLLVFFNESGHHGNAQRDAMTIILLSMVAGILAYFVIPGRSFLLVTAAQTVALYLGVDKIGENSRAATIKIVVLFVVLRLLVGGITKVMA